MADDPPRATGRIRRTGALLFRAPPPALSGLLIVLVAAALATLFADPTSDRSTYLDAFVAVFLAPALISAFLTAPLAEALGGRFTANRALLLTLLSLFVMAPLLALGHLWDVEFPGRSFDLGWMVLLALGPVLWGRDLSLYGVSNPSQSRTLPPALLQPVATLVGISVLYPWTPTRLVAAGAFLFLGWITAVQLIRATDRPLRREFQVSGIGLLRPILDHIEHRDPAATEALEAFFARNAIVADLSATLVEFRTAAGVKATIALPTVHPGPFAALGASNLPLKVADRLGPGSGLVLVPHTPCNHELDLPTGRETRRVLDEVADLRVRLTPGAPGGSPLVAGRPDSLARAQRLGDVSLVVISQAPAPTDDIAFAVGDSLRRSLAASAGGPIALMDGHNSYVEDRGDIAYGSPTARRLVEDVGAALDAARAATTEAPVEVGVAARSDLSIGEHGIGPAGIRVLAVRAGGRTGAYVLLDGNNLVAGGRATILRALEGVVDDAEVMTTDNHIVHEVDGTTNPVGARYPPERLAVDCRGLVEQAVADLTPVEVRAGSTEIPNVAVLGPSWTERLLTSLGDTVSVFGHQAVTTLALLLVSSLVVLALVR